jgi:hypothetical protein
MLPGAVLAALVASAVVAGRGGRGSAAMLALVSVVWLLVNGPMEGRVLWAVSTTHGLTAADLAGLTGGLLALLLLVFPRQH